MSHQEARIDFLIVGQGIAGVILAWNLLEKGYKIKIVHDFDEDTSSHLAAGIINPVTGRRYVKSWKFDMLKDALENRYHGIEQKLGIQCLHPVQIARLFSSVKEENDFSARLADPAYKPYLSLPASDFKFPESLHCPFAGGMTNNAYRLDMSVLINALLAYFSSKHLIINESFSFDEFKVDFGGCYYKSWTSTNVVFAEGLKVLENPYFNYLPIEPSKGQVLLVKIPALGRETLYKDKIFIAPFREDLYWVGSWYENHPIDNKPTDEGFVRLKIELDRMWKGEYEIISHIAGIRPTVKDRRPLLGQHPIYPNLLLFNGMGTKGASLVPLMADHFVDVYEQNVAFMNDVDISRYSSLFPS